jgi:hypothetical protein
MRLVCRLALSPFLLALKTARSCLSEEVCYAKVDAPARGLLAARSDGVPRIG